MSEPDHPAPRPDPRGAVRHRRSLRRTSWVLIVVGALVVVGVGIWQLQATLWTDHSDRVGHALIHQFLRNKALSSPVTTTPGQAPASAGLASCAAGLQSSDPVQGLLEIPKIGVVAPVEQGVDDTRLAVAVGHFPSSVWPGKIGNSVLEAHDVSYFVSLPTLASGDTVRYVTPCTTYTFTVSAHTVVAQGSPVYNTPDPSLTLVTCWPTDALWFTPDRYLVTATETSQTSTTTGSSRYLTASPPPVAPVPSALASQGVTLATYSLPMGTFTLAGTPNAAWAQTTNPLLIQGSGVEAFIAAVKALTESRLDWWSTLAPGVSVPAPLVGANNPSYLTPLNVTLTATGSTPTTLSLADTVAITGGAHPGRYAVAVQEAITGATLRITSWSMLPA